MKLRLMFLLSSVFLFNGLCATKGEGIWAKTYGYNDPVAMLRAHNANLRVFGRDRIEIVQAHAREMAAQSEASVEQAVLERYLDSVQSKGQDISQKLTGLKDVIRSMENGSAGERAWAEGEGAARLEELGGELEAIEQVKADATNALELAYVREMDRRRAQQAKWNAERIAFQKEQDRKLEVESWQISRSLVDMEREQQEIAMRRDREQQEAERIARMQAFSELAQKQAEQVVKSRQARGEEMVDGSELRIQYARDQEQEREERRRAHMAQIRGGRLAQQANADRRQAAIGRLEDDLQMQFNFLQKEERRAAQEEEAIRYQLQA